MNKDKNQSHRISVILSEIFFPHFYFYFLEMSSGPIHKIIFIAVGKQFHWLSCHIDATIFSQSMFKANTIKGIPFR